MPAWHERVPAPKLMMSRVVTTCSTSSLMPSGLGLFSGCDGPQARDGLHLQHLGCKQCVHRSI